MIFVVRTLSTSITADNFVPSTPPPTSLTNTNDAFDPRPKSMTVSSAHQENIPPILPHPRSMTITSEGKHNTCVLIII